MNTTISISLALRDKIKEFGHKGETYSEILERLYECAKEHQLQAFLFNKEDSTSIDEAIARAKKKWRG